MKALKYIGIGVGVIAIIAVLIFLVAGVFQWLVEDIGISRDAAVIAIAIGMFSGGSIIKN